LATGTTLFTLTDDDGDIAPVTFGETLLLTTNTPDIVDITVGGTTVTVDVTGVVVAAFGGRFGNTATALALAPATTTQIPMTGTMPSVLTSYALANSIIVDEAGVYEITYELVGSTADILELTVAVRANGIPIPSATQISALDVGIDTVFVGSTIVALAAGTVLDLSVLSQLAATLTLGSGMNASLIVKRLDM